MRWLIAGVDAENGFLLTCSISRTMHTRAGGFLDRGAGQVLYHPIRSNGADLKAAPRQVDRQAC